MTVWLSKIEKRNIKHSSTRKYHVRKIPSRRGNSLTTLISYNYFTDDTCKYKIFGKKKKNSDVTYLCNYLIYRY